MGKRGPKSVLRPLVKKAIDDFWRANHYPPTIRDIRNLTGISSTSVVSFHLKKIPDIRFGRYGKPIPRWVDELFDEYKEIMEAIDEV